MITRAKVEFKKQYSDTLIFIDESEYDVPISSLQVHITIPGYKDIRTVVVKANQVNSINSAQVNLNYFPDGLYEFLVDSPDCMMDFKSFNTRELDCCIDTKILELTECDPDTKELNKLEKALLHRSAALQLGCDAVHHYRIARSLVCNEC